MQAIFLCANPVVLVIDNFFGADVAAETIAAGGKNLVPALVLGVGGAEQHQARTNTNATVDQWSHPAIGALCEKVSDIVRLPPENCEPARLLHYEGAQKFDPHNDGFSDFSPGGAISLLEGGQRLFTTLCYLNDVEKGGETEFPALKIAVRPKLGRLLVFANTLPGSEERHPHALHAGRAVEAGEKWVLSLWWRQRMWHRPRDYPAADGEILTY